MTKPYYVLAIPGNITGLPSKDIWTSPSITLHDQQAAYDELRKRTAVECDNCDGAGYWLGCFTDNFWECYQCNGEAELCAYCNGNSTTCECGE